MAVFLSHSEKDRGLYLTLCLILDHEKIARWDVSEMSAGKSLADQIRLAIDRCSLCVFIATQNSVMSLWCSAELGAFWGADKTVVIFIADPDLEESLLPRQFAGSLRAKTPQQLIDAIRRSMLRPFAVSGSGSCHKLADRTELYVKCLELIRTSKVIRDTTWGLAAPDMSQGEERARHAYRAAVDEFIKSEHCYYELLTAQKGDQFLAEAYQKNKHFKNYECKILSVDISKLSMLDMMIADDNRVLFSHVSSRENSRLVQYVYAESETLARLFIQFYSDVWRDAIDIRDFHLDDPKTASPG